MSEGADADAVRCIRDETPEGVAPSLVIREGNRLTEECDRCERASLGSISVKLFWETEGVTTATGTEVMMIAPPTVPLGATRITVSTRDCVV